MPDYAALAATAKRLLDGAGRSLTFINLDFDAEDASKPWRGPEDPRLRTARELVLFGTQVQIASTVKLGLSVEFYEAVKKASLVFLVGSSEDLNQYDEVIDSRDGKRWTMILSETLEPGDTIILSYVVLGR
jgi:hypothetical protein